MIIYFAGAKVQKHSDQYDDPRECVGHDLNIMTTFFVEKETTKVIKDLRRKKRSKNKRKKK